MALVVAVVALAGCKTVHNVDRVKPSKLTKEGTVVFVRPTEYSLFGTKSLSDYVEITYDQARRNDAGLLEVRVGLRDRGGQHFWDVRGMDFAVSAKTTFYAEPVAGSDHRSPPVYETNWQRVMMVRGGTADYKAVCPMKEGAYYQVTLSEMK
jgi:hypothetical protein